MSPQKLCVIRPMGEPESEVRKLSDWILAKFIMPAAKEAGYETYGSEGMEYRGLTITAEIFRLLEGGPLVIAYLGYPPWNENVMFEVGYRLATSKSLVILRHSDTTLPFDLQDYHSVLLPPYSQLETTNESRDEKIVEAISRTIHYRKGLTRLNSAYAVAEVLIDQRELADGNDRESIFTASSPAADRIFHMKEGDSIIGKDFNKISDSLRPRLEEYQLKSFETEQIAILGRIIMGQCQNLDTIRSKVPFIFKDSSVDDVDLPEYVDPELRGHAFLAIIVKHRQLPRAALFLLMLYLDVTVALKREGDHFVCDLPMIAPLFGETTQNLAKRPRKKKM